MPGTATLQRTTSKAWSCLSLYPYPPPRLRNNQLWILPGKCLISTNIHLPLYNDGILTKWRTAKTPRACVFQELSPAVLVQIFLLPLSSNSIKERKYSLGNTLESPVETAEMSLWHKKELCENRQLAYLKVKVAPTEKPALNTSEQSRAWCRRDIYTHYACAPRCEKSQPLSTAQAGWNPLKYTINRNLHKSQSTLSYQCPIGRPEWSHWEKWDIYI